MKKKNLLRTFIITAASLAPALQNVYSQENNIGSCGWGSKLFENDKGVAPQVLGATTNGTFGNQTFGISSGTSGCTRDGIVRSNWRTVMFIDSNKVKLAKDIAYGEGESVETLGGLIGIKEEDRKEFFHVTQKNFNQIFPHQNVTTGEIFTSLRSLLSANKKLSQYTSNM
jgi:hypothetical protein